MTDAILRRARRTFHSLGVRNYRLYFYGQMISVVGTWMQSVAQVWLVSHVLHGSALDVGLTSAFQFLPVLVFGAWGGLVADRFDKRKVLIATQGLFAVGGVALGVLDQTGVVTLWMVYALALLLGFVTLVDNPTRQAFAIEMVGADDVVNAVSLNSAVFTGARVVGPAIAGIVIGTVGLDVCFYANGISYLAVIGGLAMMRPHELRRRPPVARARGQLREGLRYVWESPELRRPLVLAGILYTFSFNFSLLLLYMSTRVFHGGAGSYGLLLSSMGVGSLVGALAMAGHAAPTQRLIAASGFAFGASVVVAAIAPSLDVEFGALVAVGLVSMVFMAATNSSLQLTSTDAMRGRVMALYAVVFLGSTPIGATLSGWAVDRFGTRETMLAAGLIAVVSSGVALWLTVRRPREAVSRTPRRPAALSDAALEAEAGGGALTT